MLGQVGHVSIPCHRNGNHIAVLKFTQAKIFLSFTGIKQAGLANERSVVQFVSAQNSVVVPGADSWSFREMLTKKTLGVVGFIIVALAPLEL